MDIIENEIKNHQILGVRNGPSVTFGTNILAVTGLEIIILNKMYNLVRIILSIEVEKKSTF